jgi:hypothetical protein
MAKRGFARMTPEERALCGKRGGIRAHKNGIAHEYTPDEARAAGKKSGEARRKKREGR